MGSIFQGRVSAPTPEAEEAGMVISPYSTAAETKIEAAQRPITKRPGFIGQAFAERFPARFEQVTRTSPADVAEQTKATDQPHRIGLFTKLFPRTP